MINKKRLSSFIIGTKLITFSSLSSAQQVYSHGNGALEIFDAQGVAASPLWVQIWIIFMMAMFVAGLAFIKNHVAARWVVGGVVIGLICSKVVTTAFGLPMLSGYIALIHLIFWSPGLYLLLSRRPFNDSNNSRAFRIWSATMVATIVFSFIFDIRDAAIYLHYLATSV